MTVAADRLRLAVVAMTNAEQRALAAALDHHAGTHEQPRMRAFYAALCAFVDESAAWAHVSESSLPRIVDVFGDDDTSSR